MCREPTICHYKQKMWKLTMCHAINKKTNKRYREQEQEEIKIEIKGIEEPSMCYHKQEMWDAKVTVGL